MAGRDLRFIALLFLCSLLAFGCATTERITQDVLGKGRTLKKKVAFLPGTNDSGFGGESFQASANVQLKGFLGRRCDGIRLLDSRKTGRALEEISRLSSGHIDKAALGSLGRTFGLSAVVEQSIVDVEYLTAKRGIWGFRRLRPLARASLRVRAYDMETNALFFDELIISELEISEDLWKEAKDAGAYNADLGNRILSQIIPAAGKLICERLAEQPWRGYMVAGPENALTLLAGKDVGLAPGDVLEVFGPAEPVKGQGDQAYLVSGLKIGEIKVTRVEEDRAEVLPLSGQGFQRSHCVKWRP